MIKADEQTAKAKPKEFQAEVAKLLAAEAGAAGPLLKVGRRVMRRDG